MRGHRRWLGIVAATIWTAAAALPAWAEQKTLEIQVRTERPTTVWPMRYRIVANAGEDNEVAGTGNDGTTAITMTLPVNTPSWGLLDTPLGSFDLSIADDGSLSVPTGSRLRVESTTPSGSVLTIRNDVNLPDFGFRMRNPTSLQSLNVQPLVNWHSWRVTSEIVGSTKALVGAAADTAARWPLLGVIPGTRVTFTTTIGGIVDCIVTDAGSVAVRSTNDEGYFDLPASIDPDSPQVLVVGNTVHIPDFAIRLERTTSLQSVFYYVVSHPWDWRNKAFPGPSGLPGHDLFPGLAYVPGSTAHTDSCPIPLLGLAPNQYIQIVTLLGGEAFRVNADGTLRQVSPGDRIGWAGHVALIRNRLDIPGLRVALRNPTTATRVRMHIQVGGWLSTYLDEAGDVYRFVAGSEADEGIAFPMIGVVPDLDFYVATAAGTIGWSRTTASGSVAFEGTSDPSIGPGDPPIARVEGTAPGPRIVIENPIHVRCRVYGESPVTTLGDASIWSSIGYGWAFSPIDPGPFENQYRACAGPDWETGVEFRLEGMGPHHELVAASVLGPNNVWGLRFQLRSDGTARFAEPAVTLSEWKGYVPIDSNRDGTMDNRMYVEIAPLNRAPTAVLSSGNLAIQSTAQATTVISAAVSDPDGEALTCTWEVGGVPVLGPSAPTNGTTALDLGALPPLSVGNHRIRLRVSDGELAAESEIVLTIQNSPPTVSASGAGAYEIGATTFVTLGGEIADYDGDQLTYRWLANGVEVAGASGEIVAPAGGAPIAIPQFPLATSAIGLGTHTLTLEVEDPLNQPVAALTKIEVIDTTAPTLAPVASTLLLWPANHRMVDVTIAANARDASGGAVTLTVLVTSDEPAEFDGSGNFLPDHELVSIDPATGQIRLRLRAERSGQGDGRTYTVLITATDASGNTSSTATVVIKAPHDRRAR